MLKNGVSTGFEIFRSERVETEEGYSIELVEQIADKRMYKEKREKNNTE